MPPVPSFQGSDYFRTGGTLSAEAPSYIVRQADADLLRTLTVGEYAWVLDSRQKGKSSLLVRAANQLRERGARVVKLDLQRFGASLTEEQWYAALTRALDSQLKIPGGAQAHWRAHESESPAVRWLKAVESLIQSDGSPLVVFVDEVDYVRSLPFDTDEFFAVIAACYNRRATEPRLLQLTFCFAGNSTPGQLLRKPETSISSYGKRVELKDFDLKDLAPYAEVLTQLGHRGSEVVGHIYRWTSGQPFLTQLACADYLQQGGDLQAYFRNEFVLPRQRQQNDHIASIAYSLVNPNLSGIANEEARVQVLDAYLQLLRHEPRDAHQINPAILDHLHLCGVVTERAGRVWVRNRVYRETFNQSWVLDQMPDQEKVRQFRAARRATLVTTGIALAVLAVVGGFSLNSYLLVRQLRVALKQSEVSSLRAQQEAYVGTFQSISAEVQDGNPMRAGLLLSQLADSPFRGWEWNRMNRALNQQQSIVEVDGPVLGVMTYPTGRPRIVISPLTATHFSPTGQVEKTVQLPRAPSSGTTTPLGSLLQYSDGTSLLYRPDGTTQLFRLLHSLTDGLGRQVVTNPSRTAFRLQDAAGNPLGPWVYTNRLVGVQGRNPNELIVDLQDQWWLVDLRTGRSLAKVADGGMVNEALFSRDGKTAILATDNPDVMVLDLTQGTAAGVLRGNQGPVIRMAISRDETKLVTAGADGIVRVFDIPTQTLLKEFVGHTNRVQLVRFSEDEQVITSSGADHSVRTWDINMASAQQLLNDNSNGVARIKISPRQGTMASVFNDGSVKFWEYGKIQPIASIKLPTSGEVINSEMTSDGRVEGATASGLCFRTNGVVLELVTPPKAAAAAITLADGESAFFVGQMGEVMKGRWGGPPPSIIRGPTRRVRYVTANTQRTHFAIGFEKGGIEVWDFQGKQPIAAVPVDGRVGFIQFSPDGTRLVAATYTQLALEIPVGPNPKVLKLQGHTSRLYRSVYSSDGKFIATSGFDNSARVWESGTGKELFAIQHKSWVGDVSFSPDGQRLLTACGDGSARLWSVATGREIMVLQRSPIPLFGCRMSPDGNWIITSDSEGRIRAWNGSPVAEK